MAAESGKAAVAHRAGRDLRTPSKVREPHREEKATENSLKEGPSARSARALRRGPPSRQNRRRGFTTLLNTEPNVYESPRAVKNEDPDCSSRSRSRRSSSVRSLPEMLS